MKNTFVNILPPFNCQPLSKKIISKYSKMAPPVLLSIWSDSGIGKYGNGLLELVNPAEYEYLLWSWLGGKKENYLPFAINAFGDIFYHRKLTETDSDICMIDTQHRKGAVLTWDPNAFFLDFFVDMNMQEEWLRYSLFQEAKTHLETLSIEGIYAFTNLLALGGDEKVEHLRVNNVFNYHDLLFSIFEINKFIK